MTYRVQYDPAPDPGFTHKATVLRRAPNDHLPSPAEKQALADQVAAMAAWCQESFGDPFLGKGYCLREAMKWRRIGHTFLLRDEATTRAFMARWTP